MADGDKWGILLLLSSFVWGDWVLLLLCTFAASSSRAVCFERADVAVLKTPLAGRLFL